MTSSPISTISYNSPEFLKRVLDEWVEDHWIQTYSFIKHIGEEGDKDHIHLRVCPNHRLDPMELSDRLKEYDPKHPDKPLGCLEWHHSEPEDWLLYVVHDPTYLRQKYGDEYLKSGKEKIPYEYTEVVCNEAFNLEDYWHRAKAYLKRTSAAITKELEEGKSGLTMVKDGADPSKVRSCISLLTLTAYEKLSFEYSELSKHCELLEAAIREYHLSVEIQEDGSYYLTEIPF